MLIPRLATLNYIQILLRLGGTDYTVFLNENYSLFILGIMQYSFHAKTETIRFSKFGMRTVVQV